MPGIEKISTALRSRTHAALVTSDINRRYLTGFNSSAGVVVVTKDKSYFIIDSRYFEKATEAVKDCKVMLLSDLQSQLEYIFSKNGIDTICIENSEMTVSELTEYMENFPSMNFDSTSWLSDRFLHLRIIKSEDEILLIEKAQRIAERAYTKLITKIRPGMTEKQVASVLNYYMLDLGADDISFNTIAASGKNSACPHAEPTEKQLENGDFLTLDFGAVVGGYHSDMTRTLVIGKPTEAMKRVYDAVWAAHNDALKAVHADITGKLLDNVARSTLDAWDYGNYFSHGLGHGVGLEVHEAPSISTRSDFTLHEGMVITIEPGVYIPHRFGVRIEDMVVVTANGCRNLTKTPKTLVYI